MRRLFNLVLIFSILVNCYSLTRLTRSQTYSLSFERSVLFEKKPDNNNYCPIENGNLKILKLIEVISKL